MKSLFALVLLAACGAAQAFDYTTFDLAPSSGLVGEISIETGVQGLITADEVGAYNFVNAGQVVDFQAIGTGVVCPPGGCGLTVQGIDLYWTGGRINFDIAPQSGPPPYFQAISYSDNLGTAARTFAAPAAGTLIGVDPPAMDAPEIDPRGATEAVLLLAGFLAVVRGKRRVA